MQALAELEKLLRKDRAITRFGSPMRMRLWASVTHERAMALSPSCSMERQTRRRSISIAHSLKTMGRQKEAVESYQAATAARLTVTCWSLANLKNVPVSDDEIWLYARGGEQPLDTASGPVSSVLRARRALDRREFAESLLVAERSNSLKKAESRYRPRVTERNTRLVQVCTREFFLPAPV